MHTPHLAPRQADIRALTLLSVAVVAMAAGRFAALTPDSHKYLELVRHFEGAADADLVAPFAYRVAVPWLVAASPVADSATEFAAIVLLSTVVAHGVIYLLARTMTGRRDLALLGTLFCAVSPVVFSYGGRVLTDGPALLLVALGVRLIRGERVLALVLLSVVAMLFREAVIAVWVTFGLLRLARAIRLRSGAPLLPLVGVVAPIAVVLAVRARFPSVAPHIWTPSFGRLAANLGRLLTWTASASALAPLVVAVVVAALSGGDLHAGRRLHGEDRALVAAHLAAVGLLVAAAMTSAFMSPRFFWPAFVVLAGPLGLMLDGTPLQRLAAHLVGPRTLPDETA